MNIYHSLNQITAYIDAHLEEKIDYAVLARFLRTDRATLQRLFSLIAGLPLGEYIRKRRLSAAAYDLQSAKSANAATASLSAVQPATPSRVVDLAVKYTYDSAAAFSRAFAAFHGLKPSAVTSTSKLRDFPRLVFDETGDPWSDIEYSVVALPAFTLYAFRCPTSDETISHDAPRFFAETEAAHLAECGPAPYGAVEYDDRHTNHCRAYLVLYERPVSGATPLHLPAAKWLKFEIPSQRAADIQAMSHRFYERFLPSSRFGLANLPELEHYHADTVDFLVPIL